MAQHTDIVLEEIAYTRVDFAAMRAYAQRIPIEVIASSYYSDDSPQLEMGLERFLITMRNDLIERAVENNPHFAEILKGARQGGTLTVKALDILVKAAEAPVAIPQLTDSISMWFRPKTAVALRSEGFKTLADLVNIINRRGQGWYRSIPRIGKLRADVIISWINKNSITLGEVNIIEPSISNLLELTLDPKRPSDLVPIERLRLPSEYSGEFGLNRCPSFCYIQAKNDRDALLSFLSKFTEETQTHTYRAYRKELERFLLWSVIVQRKPMSSILVDDCQAYLKFIRSPIPSFTGPNVSRTSSRWKPFSDKPMSDKSAKQAFLIIRSCFQYLVDVRYLAGNPWSAVKAPSVTQEINSIRVERALSEDLYERVIAYLENRSRIPKNSQDRIALVAILLMGDSGLRRDEVAGAMRNKLTLYDAENLVYTLEVRGKGNKNRLVPVSARSVEAIKAHWKDRLLDFDIVRDSIPLLSPVVIPNHKAAIKKYAIDKRSGYTGTSLYPLIMQTWKSLRNLEGLEGSFSIDDIDKLATSSPHAFRHTFGTLAIEAGMPLDVTQSIMGHASPTTTGIYIRTKEQRMVSEAGKLFNKKSDSSEN